MSQACCWGGSQRHTIHLSTFLCLAGSIWYQGNAIICEGCYVFDLFGTSEEIALANYAIIIGKSWPNSPPFPPHHPHPPPTPISQTSHSDGCLQNQNEARQGMQGFICLFITGYLISHWYNKPADSSEICVCHGWQMLRSSLNWCQAGWVGGHTANPSSQSVYLLTSVCIRVDSVCCVSTVVISWEFFVYRVKYTRESLTWHILSSRELNIVA